MTSPRATVFIPTWFGERYLEEALTAIFAQRVDFDFEVLIIDTESGDQTPEIIRAFEREHSNLRSRTITKAEFGHGRTRNSAAHEARGEFIVFLTQDATPAHDRWLYELLKPFEINSSIMAVLGRQIPRAHCVPMLKAEIRSVFEPQCANHATALMYDDDFIADTATFDAVRFLSDVNCAVRTDFVRNTIPYRDVSYAEDQLFGAELVRRGFIKAYAPRGAVIHSNDLQLKQYAKRMFDETHGMRSVGVEIPRPSRRLVAKLLVRGVVRDWVRTLRDHEYSRRRKIYWLVVNPMFHVEKWRGIRSATNPRLDERRIARHSLEEHLARERRQ